MRVSRRRAIDQLFVQTLQSILRTTIASSFFPLVVVCLELSLLSVATWSMKFGTAPALAPSFLELELNKTVSAPLKL